jgi:hypothetical protein
VLDVSPSLEHFAEITECGEPLTPPTRNYRGVSLAPSVQRTACFADQ